MVHCENEYFADGSILMEQYRNTRKIAWINGGFIVANILYFIYLEICGSTEDAAFMLQKGAMYSPLVLYYKEYYRLLTAIFMHFGYDHLVNNMLVLFILGDNLERALGKIKYFVFYLVCGVGANIISMLVEYETDSFGVGAGASGAVFGVIGGLLYVVCVNKGQLEDLSTRQLVILIAFSLYFGFTSTGVNNVAHLAGLFFGIILAAALYRKPKKIKKTGWYEEEE